MQKQQNISQLDQSKLVTVAEILPYIQYIDLHNTDSICGTLWNHFNYRCSDCPFSDKDLYNNTNCKLVSTNTNGLMLQLKHLYPELFI